VVDDFCEDGHGVKAWAWRNGALLGSRYNGKGNNGRVTWDPYGTHNNIKKGDYIGLRACIVDGPSGAPFPGCTEGTRRRSTGNSGGGAFPCEALRPAGWRPGLAWATRRNGRPGSP
jgi:hypothetical protein